MSEQGLQRWMPALIAAALLAAFAVLGSLLAAASYVGTAERIAQNERDALLRQLGEIVPQTEYDNRLLQDTLNIQAPGALGAKQTLVYRARKAGQPVAAIFSPVIAQGYSGAIALVIGVREDGTLAGVRVLSHKETPGLGDKIEQRRSDWISKFTGRSLTNPAPADWKVKRDGGDFDQFTGATITPRAVVRAVRQTLEYYALHQTQLFAKTEEPING